MTTETPDNLISSARVAELLHVSDRTVQRWTEAGLLPSAITTPGGHRRYHVVDVERFRLRMETGAF